VSSLPVLAQTRSWIAVQKPPGRLVIPGRNEEATPPLKEAVERQLGRPVWTVHRLDRDTSGVLLFALTAEAHRSLSMAFENGKVHKRYLALVKGVFEGERLIDRPLTAARRGRMRPAHPGEEGKPSQTHVRALESFQDATLVQVEPLTGRTHQIRVHLSWEGFPLLVDPQYRRPERLTERDLGGTREEVLLDRTPLHCWRLRVPQVEETPATEIEAPVPEDLQRVLEWLRRAKRQGRT